MDAGSPAATVFPFKSDNVSKSFRSFRTTISDPEELSASRAYCTFLVATRKGTAASAARNCCSKSAGPNTKSGRKRSIPATSSADNTDTVRTCHWCGSSPVSSPFRICERFSSSVSVSMTPTVIVSAPVAVPLPIQAAARSQIIRRQRISASDLIFYSGSCFRATACCHGFCSDSSNDDHTARRASLRKLHRNGAVRSVRAAWGIRALRMRSVFAATDTVVEIRQTVSHSNGMGGRGG